jgi:adenosine deaminase
MPKAELHVHIEGTLEPELMFALAARNGVELPYASAAEVRAAYAFTNLQSFLDMYYAGCDVLRTKRDFYDLAHAYLVRARAENVLHAEIFFDPQAHTQRGVPFAAVVDGLHEALAEARGGWGFSGGLIMSFLRHLSEEDGLATLAAAGPHLDKLCGVGLDSSEVGHPPEKFARLFARCRELGLPAAAHAGEEGPAANIAAALDVLHVKRIDHGVRCTEDAALLARLAGERVPLTVCPLSNVRLGVFPSILEAGQRVREMLGAGLCVTINSDDPAYFGGYVADNYAALVDAGVITTAEEAARLARNSFEAAWLRESDACARAGDAGVVTAVDAALTAGTAPTTRAKFYRCLDAFCDAVDII